jgi:hypothetical protein
MTTHERTLEGFARHMLNGRESTTIQTSALARQGYDASLLLELIDGYAGLPATERCFEFEKDFAKLGSRHDFGLVIRRL